MDGFIKQLGKFISYIIIILIWGGFGYGYFSMYEANRPAEADSQEGNEEEQGEGSPQVVVVQVAESGRSIRPDMLCLDSSALYDVPWSSPAMQEGIQVMGVSAMRIPGGDPAAYWDWETGEILPDEARVEPINRENNLAQYLEGLKATGTTPIVVLNLVTADLQNQLAMLQTIEENGVPVRYIELGHGLYEGGMQSNYGQAFPSGREYAAAAEEWITSIRSQFPEAAISLVAAPEGIRRGPRISGWNESVYALAANLDLAVSMYPFPNQGLEPGQQLEESLVSAVFGIPFQTWGQFSRQEQAPLTSLPDGVPIWLTSYNIPEEVEEEAQIAEKYGQVLFVLTQSLIFLRDERVEFMCPHQLMGPRYWAAFFRNNQRFDVFPTGRAVRILGQAMNGMTTARPIEFSSMPPPEGANLNYPTLVGWHFEDGNGRQSALILNLGSGRVEINVGSLPEDFPKFFQETLGNPVGNMRNNVGVEIVSGDINNGRNFMILLPYSATLFSAEDFSVE